MATREVPQCSVNRCLIVPVVHVFGLNLTEACEYEAF